MPIAPAVGGALVSGGSSILSGILGNTAADKASSQLQQAQQQGINATQGAVTSGQTGVSSATAGGQAGVTAANQNANDILSSSSQQQQQLYQPYVQAGQSSVNSLQQLAGANGPLAQQFSFNPSDLSADPGYQFTLQQGQQAIQRAAAAQGGLFSSGTLKSLAGYSTGTANQYFNDAYNRAQSTFNTNRQGTMDQISTLQGLSGQGLTATGGSANAIGSNASQQSQNTIGTSTTAANLGLQGATTNSNTGIQGANIISNLLTGKGQSAAAGTVAGANSTIGAVNGVGNAIGQLLTQRSIANQQGTKV